MSSCYHRALAPTEHKCFGLRLKPLTLGHVFLLAELESPFVSDDDREIFLRDVALAILVCMHDHKAARGAIRRPWLGLSCWLLGVIVGRSKKLDEECESLGKYIREGCEAPPTKSNLGAGQASSASPWHFQILALLLSRFYISRREAMGMTVAECNSLIAAHAEINGLVKMWTAEDQSFVDWCSEQDRLTAAE